MHNPLVSIIIPIYNTEEYIRDAINSVLANEYPNYEIICVNDGSTDNSLKVIQELAEKSAQIKIINQDNKGVSFARNRGLQVATGKYVMFLDSDDLLVHCCLKNCIDFLEKESADIICFNMQRQNADGSTYTCLGVEHFKNNFQVVRALDNPRAINFINAAPSIINRKFLLNYDINFDENHIYEDWLFMVNVFIHNPLAIFLNENYYIYRERTQGNISNDVGLNCLDLFRTYRITNSNIKDCTNNSEWLFNNDLRFCKHAVFFLKSKIWKIKSEQIHAAYCREFKSILLTFNPIYLNTLLSTLPKDNKIIIQYLVTSKEKTIYKEDFKAYLKKIQMVRAFVDCLSCLISFLFYFSKSKILKLKGGKND